MRTANLTFHLPVLTRDGIDVKAGEYASPVGYETYDPVMAPFYSHSYIFDWGVPSFHTGVVVTAHLNSTVDLWYGRDTGTNTGIGYGFGDNNRSGAHLAGFGLKGLRHGAVSLLALSHFGSETPRRLSPTAEKDTRYYSDLFITDQLTSKWSTTAEFDHVLDTANNAKGFGAAVYLAGMLNTKATFNLRLEVWRDAQGAFVTGLPGSLDPLLATLGEPNTAFAIGPATYSELTAGVTFHKRVSGRSTLLIRPELRVDHSAGRPAFNGGKDNTAFDPAIDFVLTF